MASILNVDRIVDAAGTGTPMIPGHVVQVVSATLSSNESTTSSTFQATSLTASITPSSTSNKILIIAGASMYSGSTATQAAATVFRGGASGTNLGHSVYGFGGAYSSAGAVKNSVVVNYLDSPATASSQTYTVCIGSTDNINTININVNGDTSTLTLMEIAQ